MAQFDLRPPEVTITTFRSTVQPLTGQITASLMVGRQIRVPSNSFATVCRPIKTVTFADSVVQQRVEPNQHKMATSFNKRNRVPKPKFGVGDWVRVRVQVRNKKTDPIYSESHQVMSFVAPFTVLLDNGKKWHCSKLRPCSPPDNDDEVSDMSENEFQDALDRGPADVTSYQNHLV